MRVVCDVIGYCFVTLPVACYALGSISYRNYSLSYALLVVPRLPLLKLVLYLVFVLLGEKTENFVER